LDKLHVLIVDDDKDAANLFGTVLKMVGFECDVVYTAKRALSYLASSEPDMIVLDLRLGLEVGGEDILFQIRSNPRLDKTRVIIITGYPAIAEPLKNLADLILLKPIDVEQLKTLASRLIVDQDGAEHAYFRDPVTGLFTRDFFLFRLEHVFERSKRRPDLLFGLLSVDIQYLPETGQSVVEQEHNLLLAKVARRISSCFRPTDTIARIKEEQFVTLHEDLKHPEDIQVLISRLRQSLSAPFQIDKYIYRVQPTIGAVLLTEKYQHPLEILDAVIQMMELARLPIKDDCMVVN
jgi:diguanylate cyclase (GGDEF)-like protein